MQFYEKQERQLCYRFEEGDDLAFRPVFEKLIGENQSNQIAILFPRSFFWSDNDVTQMIDEIPYIQNEIQAVFEEYISKNELTSYKENVVAIEGYYKKYYENFEDVYNYNVLVILYLIIRPRKNMDGIKSLIKVGDQYEL